MTSRENVVVVAGAGTGKTHALVTEYLFTLLGLDAGGEGIVTPERVLAITFTDKAAAEMRRRVAQRLSSVFRTGAGDPEVQAQAARLGRSIPPLSTLERLHRHLAAAPIQTFHSLAQSLLRDFALEAELDPGFELLDGVDERMLVEEQTEAAVIDRLQHGDADIAELAARFGLRRFGSGRGLVESVADIYERLAERGLAPGDVPLAAAPGVVDEEVAAELAALEARVAALVAALPEATGLRYAHEHRAAIESAFAPLPGLVAAPTDDELRVARQFQTLKRALGGSFLGAAEDLRVDALRTAARLAARVVDRAAAPLAAACKVLLVDVDARVRAEKDARGVLGFGDLLLRARDLLRDQRSARARVKARFTRVLVDEYQDTSPVQEDLVALLAEEPSRGDRVLAGERAMDVLRLARGRLFVVGDPKQSIYGFRGADASLFRHTERVLCEGTESLPPTGTRRVLNVSRRSRPPVLAVVNATARATLTFDDGSRPDVDEELAPLRAGDGAAGAILQIPTDGLELDEVEPLVVAAQVQRILDDGLAVGDDGARCRPRDIAVLIRRGRPAAAIARALVRAGIPAQVTGGEGFFTRAEVVDVVCALRLLVEPDDELAGLAVLRSAFVALTDDDVLALAARDAPSKRPFSFARALAVVDDAEVAVETKERLRGFAALLARSRAQLADVPLHRLVDQLLDDGHYVAALGAEPDHAERLANIEKLRLLVECRPGDAVARVSRLWAFLDDPPKEAVAPSGIPDPDAVRVMTIHQAKGLEFPIVVLADVGAKLPPDTRHVAFSPDDGLAVSHQGRAIGQCVLEHVSGPGTAPAIARVTANTTERERRELSRLLYVGLTRARDHVFVVGEERKRGQLSLRRLLAMAWQTERATLLPILPIVRVTADGPTERALPSSRLVVDALVAPAPPRAALRREPSALAPAEPHVPGPRGWRVSRRHRVRGALIHALVARAGEALVVEADRARARVDALLDAALRAEGHRAGDDETVRAKALARDTLERAVLPLVDEGYALSFEEALTTTMAPHDGGPPVVLRGTADLVARRADGVLVVDLKSSAAAARHPSTRLQLAAYAAALRARDERPVTLLALVVGEPLDLERATPYDAALEDELRRSLATTLPAPGREGSEAW